jgi:hypothetical protein
MRPITPEHVLSLVGSALRAFPSVSINDVDATRDDEVILTLDDGDNLHVFRVTVEGITNITP